MSDNTADNPQRDQISSSDQDAQAVRLDILAASLQRGLESIGNALKDGLSDGMAVTVKAMPDTKSDSRDSQLKDAQKWQAWTTVAFLIVGGIGLGYVGHATTTEFNEAQTNIGNRQNEIAGRGNEVAKFQTQVVERQARTAEQKRISDEKLKSIELVERFIPHLETDGTRRKAALLTIQRLSSTDLMLELSLLFGGEGAADAMSELAHRYPELNEFGRVRSTYETVVSTAPELALPNVRFATEERTRSYFVTTYKPEERSDTKKIARQIYVRKPVLVVKQDDNGNIIRDDQGQPVTVRQEFTETETVYEDVEQTYTVMVPQQEMREFQRTVLVPQPLEETTPDFIGAQLVSIFAGGPQQFDTVLSALLSSLRIPPSKNQLVRNLRREILWRTRGVPGTNLIELNERDVRPVTTGAIPTDVSTQYPKRRWQFDSERSPLEATFVSRDLNEVTLRVGSEGLIAIPADEFSYRDTQWLMHNTQEPEHTVPLQESPVELSAPAPD